MHIASITSFCLATVLWATVLPVHGQDEWKAPRIAAAISNPIATSAESIRSGNAVYAQACVACHGKTGLGDGFAASMLKAKPKDLGEVLGGQSDGEVFWKIRTGNEFMASLAGALSEDETWHVINFIRTFEPEKPGELPGEKPGEQPGALLAEQPVLHPWASFPEGAWVDVHTDHEMVLGEGAEPTAWASDSRMSVGAVTDAGVILHHVNPAREISEQASVPIPAVDALPGVRPLGQWPHDIFPFGPERDAGVTPEDKQPIPRDVTTQVLREEDVEVDGEPRAAQVIQRAWLAGRGDTAQQHVLTAWVVEGLEVPVRWTRTVDGETLSVSELVNVSDAVQVGPLSIDCVVTVTRKHLDDGVIVKRRWSSTQVPGFLVKMESELEADAYSLSVNEWVTGFQSSADEGNPPGSRPALGFMPDYQSMEDGVLVGQVTAGGPAAQAGLEAGDLITEIGGEPILGLEDYMDVISALRIGRPIAVQVERDGKTKQLSVVVGQR